jgi:hypothetical protein
MVATFNITHKQQTKMNDCWYACIQMIRTHRANGTKTKAIGAAVHTHRAGVKLTPWIWGQPIADNHPNWSQILLDNKLKELPNQWGTQTTLKEIQDTMELHGPLIVGGSFGKVGRIFGSDMYLAKGQGHYIVVCGTDSQANVVHVDDPWAGKENMPLATFRQNVWSVASNYGSTIVANDGP